MKNYTDNKLFNCMANMIDQMQCKVPECKELRDHNYDDYCSLHEKAISDARDEWDSDRTARDYE